MMDGLEHMEGSSLSIIVTLCYPKSMGLTLKGVWKRRCDADYSQGGASAPAARPRHSRPYKAVRIDSLMCIIGQSDGWDTVRIDS